jgi:hypothetical protein
VRLALVAGMMCLAHVASAAPRHVLVLRAEGTADAASRAGVDSHVARLARHIDGKVEVGEITLTEAAALVGCNPSETACKDEVLATLGVDEVVATTVTATPTGMNITVRRISHGTSRAAQTTVAAGKSPDARLDTDIGPLFGIVASPPSQPATTEPGPTTTARPTAERGLATEPRPTTESPAPLPSGPPSGDDPATGTADTLLTVAPTGTIAPMPAEGVRSRRLSKIGLAAGGGFVVLGFLMWAGASDVQNQIDSKPEPRTPADFAELRDLERKGDDIASVGNFFFVAGVITGGVSAYFYWRTGRSPTSTARIAPAVYPQGAGVTLTIGGLP